jgi:hypothetical protein
MNFRDGFARALVYFSILYWLCVVGTIAWIVNDPRNTIGYGGPYDPGLGPVYPWQMAFAYLPPIDPLMVFWSALIFYLICFGAAWVLFGFFSWPYYRGCGCGRCGGHHEVDIEVDHHH